MVKLGLKLSLYLLWPVVILDCTLETLQCAGIPKAYLSWHSRVTGWGQARVHWGNSQAKAEQACGTAERRDTPSGPFVDMQHTVGMLTKLASSLFALRPILCISQAPLSTGFWVVKTSWMRWQRRAESRTILSFPVYIGWHFWQWLSPLSPNFCDFSPCVPTSDWLLTPATWF